MKHTHSRRDLKARRDQLTLQSKRKRLIYLFMRDLSSGICGEVLANKTQRDAFSTFESSRKRVTVITQVLGWMCVFLMNMGMLLYVYLFAMTQNQSRQSAWFQSFVMWFIFEIFVSSTGLVVFFHLLVPLYVFTEVSMIKEKVMSDLILFQQKYLKTFTKSSQPGGEVVQKGLEFNAAKYLFISWRVASLSPDLPESRLVLQFSTPWPKKKFGAEESEVTHEYDQAVILTALSRVLLYFVASLLRCHMLIQDIILQLVCNSGFASLIFLFIQAARIHPLLPVACVIALFLVVFLMVRWMSRRSEDMVTILRRQPSSVLPTPSSTPPAPLQPSVSNQTSSHNHEPVLLDQEDWEAEEVRPINSPHVLLPCDDFPKLCRDPPTEPVNEAKKSHRTIVETKSQFLENELFFDWEDSEGSEDMVNTPRRQPSSQSSTPPAAPLHLPVPPSLHPTPNQIILENELLIDWEDSEGSEDVVNTPRRQLSSQSSTPPGERSQKCYGCGHVTTPPHRKKDCPHLPSSPTFSSPNSESNHGIL